MDRIENERALILALLDNFEDKKKYQLTGASDFTGPRKDIWACLGDGDAADLWKLSREILIDRQSADLLTELAHILANRGLYFPLMSDKPFGGFLMVHRTECWKEDLVGLCEQVLNEADHGGDDGPMLALLDYVKGKAPETTPPSQE